MYKLDLEKDCKEIQPVHPEGNQSWIFIGRTDAELKLQYFGHLTQRTDSLEKTGRDWRQEKGTTEDEMVGWRHWLDGCEFERQWRTGKPGVLQRMESQKVRYDLVTEQQQGIVY